MKDFNLITLKWAILWGYCNFRISGYFHMLQILSPYRFLNAFKDKWTWIAVAAGSVGFLFASGPMPPVWRLLFSAFTEELAFRALLQETIEEQWPLQLGILTFGNGIASFLFALSHLFTQSVSQAFLTFFPSLLLGVLWSRHRSLLLCWGIHILYNVLFFWK